MSNHGLLGLGASRGGFGTWFAPQGCAEDVGGFRSPREQGLPPRTARVGRQVPLLSQSSLKLHICSYFVTPFH